MSLQRLKLILIQTRKTVPEVMQGFRNHPDGALNCNYHRISLDESNKLFVTYSEKLEFNEEAYDQLGNVIDEISYVTYRNVKFHIEVFDNQRLMMVVYDAPKSLKSFLDNFSSLFNFEVGFFTPELDINLFQQVLEVNTGTKLDNAGKVKASRIVLDKNSKAVIEITSIKNVFDSLDKLISSKNYYIDKLATSISISGYVVGF